MTTLTLHAETMSELLSATRRLAGLTTREIAPLVGVSQATISNWERGKGEPTVTQFFLWARATKQPAQQLLDGLNLDVARPEGLEPPTFWLGGTTGLDESGFVFNDALDVEYEALCIVEAVVL